MRRTDQLITAARLISRNSANADGTFAISDEEVLQYLNDAQDRLQNLISAEKNIAKIFVTQQIISVVANQEAYTIPDRVLMNKQIEQVEFSADGTLGNYIILEKLNFFNRDTNPTTYPWGYFKRGGQIYLQPTPSTSVGSIRVTYERDLDDLDIPRGVVNGITGGASTQFTTVGFTASPAATYASTTPGWSNVQYFSIVDPNGVRKAYNILSGSYDSVNFIMTPSPSPFVYTANDVQIATGDTAVFGKYTTTFSQLPDSCERYLIHWAAAEMLHKDSSKDYDKEMTVLESMEQDIIKALKSQTSEVQFIPSANRYEWY